MLRITHVNIDFGMNTKAIFCMIILIFGCFQKKYSFFIGAPLSDREFGILINKIDTNHDGKIDIKEFDAMLHCEVTSHDINSHESKVKAREEHSRYSNTFKSSMCLHHHQLEYESLMKQSKLQRQNNLHFAKLQELLKNKSNELVTGKRTEHYLSHRHSIKGLSFLGKMSFFLFLNYFQLSQVLILTLLVWNSPFLKFVIVFIAQESR